jgi:diguanylate cyclase (GGDEF)-like protein
LGHAAGDHVLRQVARIMLDVTRKDDTVARVGGDEFVIVLAALVRHQRLGEIARALIRRIEAPMTHEGRPCQVSASIGIAVADEPGRDPATLLEQADVALYASKRGGRAQHRFFDDDVNDVNGGCTGNNAQAAGR